MDKILRDRLTTKFMDMLAVNTRTIENAIREMIDTAVEETDWLVANNVDLTTSEGQMAFKLRFGQKKLDEWLS